MSTHALRPWTDFVKLHPDVEQDRLTDSMFAVDLGLIAEGHPDLPVVHRDAEAFFRATYLTTDLRKLLHEILACLAGRSDYNRVIKLRTAFGGGKSHTLACLYHAVKSRSGLKACLDVTAKAGKLYVREEEGAYGKAKLDPNLLLEPPAPVHVVVFDGEKFTAEGGKEVGKGQVVNTMWGWIAWQIGAKAYKVFEKHDRDRVAPSGDEIRKMLMDGAEGQPVLILLDEVLKYMERAGAVAVLDSTLQRQAKDFFQNLTVEVANCKQAAMVYTLTWSARESLNNIALLQEIEKLAGRVDQLREPVSGEEVLYVIKRRLLACEPPDDAATEIAQKYSEIVTGMRRAYAETPSEKTQAEEEGQQLLARMKLAYPFHPALLDVMRERWSSHDDFQRTRGALRFLASCLQAAKNDSLARAVLGPAEVPLKNAEVRVKLLKELQLQNTYDAPISADIEGPNARARKIDERMARETPALTNVKPATRLATAVLLYSFGGLRRESAGATETLPPGVTEGELLAACVGPDLDHITARAVLGELRGACLYLHYDGVRYCFKKDPNVVKLIEDAEQEVGRNPDEIREKIKEMLDKRLAGRSDAIVWPAESMAIPKEEPRFLVAYLPLEFIREPRDEQEKQAKDLLFRYGDTPRTYRNGVCLAIPDRKQADNVRRAVRYLLAVERVESKKTQYRLTKEQLEELKERRKTEEAAAESAFRSLYGAVWLPRLEGGKEGLEKVEAGGRPLQATSLHERVMELLTGTGASKVYATLRPTKVAERVGLGESPAVGEPPRAVVKMSDVQDAFFGVMEPPRLISTEPIRRAIANGVAERRFGYASGAIPAIGADGKAQISREKVTFDRPLAEDEVDFETGFIIAPAAIPEAQAPAGGAVQAGQPVAPPVSPPMPAAGPTAAPATKRKVVTLKFSATRDQVFKAFPAIANLADKSDGGKVSIQVEGTSEEGYDPNWLRNAVEEPLDEGGIGPE